MQHMQASLNDAKQLTLLERSVFSDRKVFVRAVHTAGLMSEMELKVYDSWVSPFIKVCC